MGSEIDSYMKGLEKVNGMSHEHSEAAYQILGRYYIDHQIEVIFGIFLLENEKSQLLINTDACFFCLVAFISKANNDLVLFFRKIVVLIFVD